MEDWIHRSTLKQCGFDPNLPSSFKVYEEQHPIEPRKPGSTRRGGKCPGAQEYFKKIQLAITEARINLEAAQQRQKAYADTKRREVKFKVGDVVSTCIHSKFEFEKG